MESRMKVLYDDCCAACTVGKNFAQRFDHRYAIKFVGMSTEEGKRLMTAFRLDTNQSAYAVKGGLILNKRQMMCEVLSHDGLIGSIVSIPFRIPYLGDWLYDLLAVCRSRITTSTA
jgi:predicted DCC family thiol-disulfide oxidoreductase YuxK